MKRDLEEKLHRWIAHPLRKPLLLRGARQVGKSWLAQRLGEQFDHFVEINFEKEPNAKTFFKKDLIIHKIVEQIGIYKKCPIVPGKTLLFLDEIQECEEALKALRYFKEDLPKLHVIAAGSLLDFTIEKIGLPVGRLQMQYVHPLSFGEFLTAMGAHALRQKIDLSPMHTVFHEELIEFLHTYFWLGGLPEVVKTWRDYHRSDYCLEMQDEIIETYKKDIEKYSKKHKIETIEKVFSRIPYLLGKKFKYVNVDPEIRSVNVKHALHLLQMAGIAHVIYHSSGQGIPLAATKNEKRFKVYLFDIGLAQRMLKVDLAEWLFKPLEVSYIGAISEQFVLQELVFHSKTSHQIYYWHREAKTSNAEVDFLIAKDGNIIPIEVKSGKAGSLKSMQSFLKGHPKTPYGIKICEAPYDKGEKITSIPLYAIETWMEYK